MDPFILRYSDIFSHTLVAHIIWHLRFERKTKYRGISFYVIQLVSALNVMIYLIETINSHQFVYFSKDVNALFDAKFVIREKQKLNN